MMKSFREFMESAPTAGEFIENEKQLIYQMLFYAGGLVLGSFALKSLSSGSVMKVLQTVFKISSQGFVAQFWANLALYVSVFAIALILGLCIIGYPIIFAIPAFSGLAVGIKVTYFYLQYGFKGIGYTVLMILPESAAVVTVLMFTVGVSAALSRYIIQSAAKTSTAGKPDAKYLLKKYLLYLLCIVLTALVNATLNTLLHTIIKI